MNLETLAQVGEFVGGIGVILSLIYVAVQMRANTRSQQADITARVLDRMASMQHTFAVDAEINAIFMKGIIDTGTLSVEERNRFSWIITELFGSLEFLRQQFEAGNVDAEIWERWSKTLDWWLTFAGIQAFWCGRPTPYTQSFTGYMESRLEAGEGHFNEERWQAFMLTGDPNPAENTDAN